MVSSTGTSEHKFTCNGNSYTESHVFKTINSCYKQCSVCSHRYLFQSHDYSYEIVAKDSISHYTYCACGSVITQNHTYIESGDYKICQECNYKISTAHTHNYIYSPCNDGKYHYKTCSCGIKTKEYCIGISDGSSALTKCVKCEQRLFSDIIINALTPEHQETPLCKFKKEDEYYA